MEPIKMSDVRAKFPQYADLSDDQLLIGLRQKFYSDIPMSKFTAMVDRDTERARAGAELTAGMSATDRVLSGAGKAFSDLGLGVRQLLGRASEAEVAEARARDKPLMETTGGTVGNIVGNVAALAPTAMIPGANTVAGASVIGGLGGALQPSTSTGETLTNTAFGLLGGAAGQKIANKIGSVAANTTSPLTLGQQQAARVGRSIGMRLTPGKASGSGGLQRIEAALESNPVTSGGFDAIKEANQKALNRAAAKAIGETADELSAPVLQRADQRIGAVFNSVKDKTPVPLDPVSVGGRLSQIRNDFDGMLMGNADLASNGLWQRLDDFVNNKGGASREQLRSLSSNLGKAAKNNMTSPNGDRALGEALFMAQDVVEDAIEGTLTTAQRRAYQEARGQYRNLMMLTAKTNVTNPASGNVNGRSLATTLMQKDRGGYTMGKQTSDLYNAARFTQAFPNIVGDSGTATRSMNALDYMGALPFSLATRGYLSEPVAKLAAGAGKASGVTARALDRETIKLLAKYLPVGAGLQLSQSLQQ